MNEMHVILKSPLATKKAKKKQKNPLLAKKKTLLAKNETLLRKEIKHH
jgi:hypothetical protein